MKILGFPASDFQPALFSLPGIDARTLSMTRSRGRWRNGARESPSRSPASSSGDSMRGAQTIQKRDGTWP